MALKKPSDFFGKKSEENNLPVVESDNILRDELCKVESLSEQVTQLQQELSQKVVKNDLESLVLSQINTMQENFEYLQNDFRKSNKKDIGEFKNRVSELTEIVGNLVEKELPKYKKQVTNNEVRIGEKFDTFREVVEENIVDIRQEIDSRVENIVSAIDENLEYFSNQLQETSSEVKRTTDTYNKLSKIVESRVSKENEKLEEYSQVIQGLYEAFVELEASLEEETSSHLQVIEEKFESISLDVKNKIDDIGEEVESFKGKVSSEISNIKADVVIFEKHNNATEKTIQEFSEQLSKISKLDESIVEINENIDTIQNQYEGVLNQTAETKNNLEVVERYIQNHHQELIGLKEEVFTEIKNLPVGNIQENLERLEKKIDFIKETYSKIEPEVLVKEVIQEGLLNEPPETKNSDPLTPLDQNFVTLDQLQQHYRLFINRIQQQLATLGGGGETRLRYLDDVVGVATNSSAYDGKYLQWNSTTNTAEFTDVTGAGVQVNSDWNATSGISSILNKPTIVNQIIAGTGITISPSNGIGTVTINATGGVGSATTGYYGSFYDTTTQYSTGAGTTTAVKLNTTAAANGFTIQSGSRIVAEYAGVYNTQFSFQLDKASGASANTWIWLSKNGIDLPETSSTVAVQGTNAETVPAWNFIVDMIPGDYLEYKWMTDDVNIGITSAYVPTVGNPPIPVNIPNIPSAIVTIQQISGVVAGVGNTVQTLDQTLGYGNTSSRGFSVGVASVTTLSGVGNTFIGLTTNIVPTVASRISLGTSAFPFKDIVISAGTLTIADADPLVDGVAISNTAQYLQLSRGGFKILSGIGTLFQIDPFTALVTSAAPTIITDSDNTSGIGSGSLQTAGGAYIAKDLRVDGNYYGNGANLSGIVTYITAGSGISISQSTGNVTITATGVGGTQNLNTTLGYGNTSSLGMSVGISTFTSTSGTTVIVGGANTALVVNDNALITGVTTFGTTNTVVIGGATTSLVVNDNATITGITSTFRAFITANGSNQYAPLYLSGNPTATPPSSYGLISVGALNYNDSNNIACFTDSVNNYTQVVAQNKNSGNSASSDFIVANNTSGPNSYYGDFGINASGFTGSSVWDDPNGTYLYASSGTLSLGTDDAKDVRIATGSGNNSPVTRITVRGTTGNVGIGSTLPNYGFVVQGSVHFHDGFYDSVDSIGAANAVLSNTGVSSATKWITNPTFTALNITGIATVASNLVVNGGTLYANATTNNVGVGTTNPTSSLHVVGNTLITGIATVNSNLVVNGNTLYANATTNNVGVGTTNPTSRLDVVGNVKITGVTTITGNLNAPGNYYVKIARTTDQTALNGADTLLGFSVISDPNNWYSGITTRTTPTVAGTYHVDLMVNWYEGTITNNQTNIQLRKNGSTFAISLVGIHTFSYTQNACGIVTMNGTTDYIDATVYTSNPTSQNIRGTADGSWTKMEIFKIN